MLRILSLLLVGYATIFALNTVEININNTDLELGLAIDMNNISENVEPETVFIGFKFLHADEGHGDFTNSSINDFYELSFLMQRAISDDFEAGLGIKINTTKDFTSVPLHGILRYSFDTSIPVYLSGFISYAPPVLSLQDANKFSEYRVTLDIAVIEGAMISLGYRIINTEYKIPASKDITYNRSAYVGFKFQF